MVMMVMATMTMDRWRCDGRWDGMCDGVDGDAMMCV
jgi:hypothetical protein